MRKYPTSATVSEVSGMRLGQLLEQEGQPCSYCIAVFLLRSGGEELSEEDSRSYSYHLAREHGVKTYWIEP